MSLKLYYAPGACSFVPHALLEMAGATFEPVLVKLHRGEQNEAAFRAINPQCTVPALRTEVARPSATHTTARIPLGVSPMAALTSPRRSTPGGRVTAPAGPVAVTSEPILDNRNVRVASRSRS